MPTLEEKILDTVAAKLATIPGVTAVRRPSAPLSPLEIAPDEILLRHDATRRRLHLRGAVEMRIVVSAVVAVPNEGASVVDDRIRNRKAAVEKVVYDNPRWNDGSGDLAVMTEISGDEPHELEIHESIVTGRVTFEILARADLSNLDNAKAI